MYEAKRWHDGNTPMIALDSGKHLFIGDFVKIKGYDIYGKVEKFALEVSIIIISLAKN